MHDLISRHDVIEAICTWDKFGVDERSRVVPWYEGLEPYVHLRDVVLAIEKLPPAQPEIIRCKDCRHYQFADNRAFGMPVKMCKWFGFEDVDDYDFCSRAERRGKS